MIVAETSTGDNGINIEHLMYVRQALIDSPAAAQFTWRGECEWVSGAHSCTSIDGFYGLTGDQVRSKGPHIYTTDHPEHFGSRDAGATPAEMLLAALAGCLTAGLASIAALRGVTLNSVKATVEGDMDLQGIMGIDPDVRNGFRAIRVSYRIDADASDGDIRDLVSQSQRRSAVFDIVMNPTAISVEIA